MEKRGKSKGSEGEKEERHSVTLRHNIIWPSIRCFQGYFGEVNV